MTSISTHPLFQLLSTETQRRTLIIEQNIGETQTTIHKLLDGTESHMGELNMEFTQRKGSGGIFGEQLIIGERGDNRCAADDGIVEIKTVSVLRSTSKKAKYDLSNGYKLKENLRLTKLNPQTIQTTSFEDSGLVAKSIMLVMFVEYDKKVALPERKIVGFAFLDLRPHFDEIANDYVVVAELCRQGQANTFRSSHTQVCMFAKLYSNGQGPNLNSYMDVAGNVCKSKNKSFYIFKDTLVDILDII